MWSYDRNRTCPLAIGCDALPTKLRNSCWQIGCKFQYIPVCGQCGLWQGLTYQIILLVFRKTRLSTSGKMQTGENVYCSSLSFLFGLQLLSEPVMTCFIVRYSDGLYPNQFSCLSLSLSFFVILCRPVQFFFSIASISSIDLNLRSLPKSAT